MTDALIPNGIDDSGGNLSYFRKVRTTFLSHIFSRKAIFISAFIFFLNLFRA